MRDRASQNKKKFKGKVSQALKKRGLRGDQSGEVITRKITWLSRGARGHPNPGKKTTVEMGQTISQGLGIRRLKKGRNDE